MPLPLSQLPQTKVEDFLKHNRASVEAAIRGKLGVHALAVAEDLLPSAQDVQVWGAGRARTPCAATQSQPCHLFGLSAPAALRRQPRHPRPLPAHAPPQGKYEQMCEAFADHDSGIPSEHVRHRVLELLVVRGGSTAACAGTMSRAGPSGAVHSQPGHRCPGHAPPAGSSRAGYKTASTGQLGPNECWAGGRAGKRELVPGNTANAGMCCSREHAFESACPLATPTFAVGQRD